MATASQQPPTDHRTPAGTGVTLAQLIALREEAARLNLVPRGRILATRSGGHLSRFRGRGMEFDESRLYVAGDDTRNMDWRVTARTGNPHVKCYREERERPVWLLVDLGPSMRFGTRTAFKSVIAAQAAALLAWAACDQGDRIGGLIFDETRHFEHRPAPRTRGLLPLLNALSQPPLPGSEGGHASFSEGAEHLLRLVRPGSLVFLLSDCHHADRSEAAWLVKLAAHSEVVMIDIVDPMEITAPPPGLYPVSDGVRRSLFDSHQRALRTTWQQRFQARTEWLDTLALQQRAHLVRLQTDQDVGPTLLQGLRAQAHHNSRRRSAP